MSILDKASDKVASKLSGRKVETISVSLDEILNQLEKVLNEADAAEIKDIEKVLKGWFLTALRTYDTKNEKYRVTTLYAGTMRSKRLINEVSVMDKETGKIYTYKVFLFKGKFKKAAKQLVNKYKK